MIDNVNNFAKPLCDKALQCSLLYDFDFPAASDCHFLLKLNIRCLTCKICKCSSPINVVTIRKCIIFKIFSFRLN